MRPLLLFALISAFSATPASGADSITPGMPFDVVAKTLQRHGYEVDKNHGGAVVASNKNRELDFCRIDGNITLVIEFERNSRQVTSMNVVFSPVYRIPKEHRIEMAREVFEIKFEQDGIYTLKMKRNDDKKTAGQK